MGLFFSLEFGTAYKFFDFRFQLVNLQIRKLCNMRHEADIRQAMGQFSQDTLEGLYAKTYQAICSEEKHARNIAIHAFALLLCLREPLSPNAFLGAIMKIDRGQQSDLQLSDLIRVCFSLIYFDSHLNALRFVHSSVQDFLEMQPGLTSTRTNQLVAISCLNACLYDIPTGLDHDLYPVQKFYHYAALYWAKHASVVLVRRHDEELDQMVKEFVFEEKEPSLPFIGWLEDVENCAKILPRHHALKKDLSALTSPSSTPLFTACVFGLDGILHNMKNNNHGIEWDQKNDLGQSGLYLASVFGHKNIARDLLNLGVDVHVNGGKHGSPLQASCFEGHIHISQLLLNSGANPNLSATFESALHASMLGGNEDIALMNFEQGFDINDQKAFDGALQNAAQTGNVRIVQHLQRRYGSLYGTSSSGR